MRLNEKNEIEPKEKWREKDKGKVLFSFLEYRRDPGRSLGGSQGDQREMNFFGIDGHQFAAYFGSVLRLHKERQEDEKRTKIKYE